MEILQLILEYGPMSIGEISRFTNNSKAIAKKLVWASVEQGFVKFNENWQVVACEKE